MIQFSVRIPATREHLQEIVRVNGDESRVIWRGPDRLSDKRDLIAHRDPLFRAEFLVDHPMIITREEDKHMPYIDPVNGVDSLSAAIESVVPRLSTTGLIASRFPGYSQRKASTGSDAAPRLAGAPIATTAASMRTTSAAP